MKAAIFHKVNEPLAIEDVDIDTPVDREVLVRTMASGVCHSDLHIAEGVTVQPAPFLLGHESSGVVESVGPGVTYVKPGDRVITCPSLFCGQCRQCLSGHPNLCSNRPARAQGQPPRLSLRGTPVGHYAGIGSFAERMLVHENSLVKLDNDIPFDVAAVFGCTITTGVGAVLNTAKIEPGSAVAVFGAGGVGLAAIQGARIGGARAIIAVDLNEARLKMALKMGATHAINPATQDPVKAIRDLTGDGVDYAFEAIGLKKVAEQAFEVLRPTGVATLIGVMPVGTKLELDARALLMEKKMQGSQMGSNRFRIDLPRYIDFYRQGRLKLDDMITNRRKLKDVNEAFRAMKAGDGARSVLLFE